MDHRTKNFIIYFINLVYLCLGISSAIIGFVDKNDCGYTIMKFININNFLIIIGIGSIFFSFYYITCNILLANKKIDHIPKSVILLVTILYVLFIIFWYVAGYCIIISNSDCVFKKSFRVIYVLVIWSLLSVCLAINQTVFYYQRITDEQYYMLLI